MNTDRPLSSITTLLDAAVFEMNPIGQEDIGLVCWEQFVKAVKESPGSTLAHALQGPIDGDLCQKIINLALEIFNSLMAKDWLQGEAQTFAKLIDLHAIQRHPPSGIHGLEKDFFQLLGILYDLLNDHAQSAKAYHYAAMYAEEDKEKYLAVELIAKTAIQVLSINPKVEKNQREAADWLEHAEDALKDSQSSWEPIINGYQRALELLQGDYTPSAKILERMGKIYESKPEGQNQAKQSFMQAAVYYGFLNNDKDRARNLEKAAICAARLGDGAAEDIYKQAAEAYASVDDHFSATRCFSEAILQGQHPQLQSVLHERAAFHSHQLGKYVDARGFYAKISSDDEVYDPNIYLKYTLLAADRLAEGRHKESAACFKEAAIYYEEHEQFLDAAQCLEKLLQQRAKYKDHTKIKDFEILGRIANAYKRCGRYIKALNCCKTGFLEHRSPIDWEKTAGECLVLLEDQPLSEPHEEQNEVIDTLLEIAEILKKKKSGELAAKTYELIEKWQPKDLPETAALFREAGEWFDFTLKHYLFALECYERAARRYLRLKQFKNAAIVFRNIGFLYQECNEPLKAAENYVAAAEQSRRSHQDLSEDLSPSDRALDLAKAAKLYNQAGCQQKAIDCYLSAATLNREIQNYEEAGEQLQAAAEFGSDHLYEQAAECFLLALKIEKALSCYKHCSHFNLPDLLASRPFDRIISKLSANLDKASCHKIIALFCSEMELWSHAAWHLHEAGSCLQEEAPSLAAEYFRFSADAHFEGLDFSKAVKAYLLAAKLSDGMLQADCFFGAARCYTKMNLRNEAVHYFSRATEIYEPIDINLAIESLKQAIDCKTEGVILMGLYGHILTLLKQNNNYKRLLKKCWLEWKDRPLNDLQSIVWVAKGFAKTEENDLAAGAYLRASKLTADRHQISFYLEKAINHYKLANNPAFWVELSEELASLYLEFKQDIQAANVFTDIGDFYENAQDCKNAAQFFLKAASLFKLQISEQSAKYYQKAAGHFAAIQVYDQAGECYQRSGHLYLSIDLDLALASYESGTNAFKQAGDEVRKDLCSIEAAREFSQRGKGREAVCLYKEVSPVRSDPNTMILYLEQAALSSEETDPAFAASCFGAVACKLSLKMDHATAEKYKRAAYMNQKALLFEKAAIDYHLAKDFYLRLNKNKEEAASCCRSAAECLASLSQSANSIFDYQQAGLLYISIDVTKAIECFECAAQQENNPRASILSCLEKIHKISPLWKNFLTQAAEWFEKENEFMKAMGIYGMLLGLHHKTLLPKEIEGIRKKIESCLKQCKNLKEGLVEAAIWAAKALAVGDFVDSSTAAALYKLAGIWEQDKQKAVEYLKKATDFSEMAGMLPPGLPDHKRLAELYKTLGKFREAGFLFEKIGLIYKCNTKLYEDAANFLMEGARCHKGSGNVSQAVNSVSVAAKCWKILRRFDQVGNCLELAGEWGSLTSPGRAIADFLNASANFERMKMDKRVEQCLHRAAALYSQLGRNDLAVSLYGKIGLGSRVYDRKTHIGYLDQLASTLITDQESLSRSLYYQQISDLYGQDDQLGLSEEYHSKATQFKEKWLQHKIDLLLELLLKSQEYKDGYQQFQKWIEEMTSAEMIDEGLEFLKQSNFESMTQQQLRHLKSNCHPERSKRWSKDQSYQVQIEMIFEIIMKKTEAAPSKSEKSFEERESSYSSSQDGSESEASESSLPALDID